MFLWQVNDMDMAGVTREEAVLYLLSLQDQIDLIGENNLQSGDYLLVTYPFNPISASLG
jgi:tight junction protein 1